MDEFLSKPQLQACTEDHSHIVLPKIGVMSEALFCKPQAMDFVDRMYQETNIDSYEKDLLTKEIKESKLPQRVTNKIRALLKQHLVITTLTEMSHRAISGNTWSPWSLREDFPPN